MIYSGMKRFLTYLLVGLTSILAVSCIKNMYAYDVDWTPVYVIIYANDADGNSIVTPDMPGMKLSFQGTTYEVQTWEEVLEKANTRAYLARLYGLFSQPGSEYSDEVDAPYRLVFGEIDGAADMDEDILLTWPDGTTDTIHYHCSDHQEDPTPKCKRSWLLNGESHEGNIFKFTK